VPRRRVRALARTSILPRRPGLQPPRGCFPKSPSPSPPEDCTLLLSNLLLNAIQHSPSALDCRNRPHHWTPIKALEPPSWQFKTTAEGIPGEALPHVFDRFYRGDPSRTRNTGGTGLALAIAKAIAQKAAGSINLTSQPDPSRAESGHHVIVRLPIASSLNPEN